MKKRMTKAQKEWCEQYEEETGFEPLMDDFLHGQFDFVRCARNSVKWFEDWSTDTLLNIGRHIPGEYE